MLCYAMLCYAMLCYAVLCCAVLYCAMLCYLMERFCAVPVCYTVACYTKTYWIQQRPAWQNIKVQTAIVGENKGMSRFKHFFTAGTEKTENGAILMLFPCLRAKGCV